MIVFAMLFIGWQAYLIKLLKFYDCPRFGLYGNLWCFMLYIVCLGSWLRAMLLAFSSDGK